VAAAGGTQVEAPSLAEAIAETVAAAGLKGDSAATVTVEADAAAEAKAAASLQVAAELRAAAKAEEGAAAEAEVIAAVEARVAKAALEAKTSATLKVAAELEARAAAELRIAAGLRRAAEEKMHKEAKKTTLEEGEATVEADVASAVATAVADAVAEAKRGADGKSVAERGADMNAAAEVARVATAKVASVVASSTKAHDARDAISVKGTGMAEMVAETKAEGAADAVTMATAKVAAKVIVVEATKAEDAMAMTEVETRAASAALVLNATEKKAARLAESGSTWEELAADGLERREILAPTTHPSAFAGSKPPQSETLDLESSLQLAEWVRARKDRQYVKADMLRTLLRAKGHEPEHMQEALRRKIEVSPWLPAEKAASGEAQADGETMSLAVVTKTDPQSWVSDDANTCEELAVGRPLDTTLEELAKAKLKAAATARAQAGVATAPAQTGTTQTDAAKTAKAKAVELKVVASRAAQGRGYRSRRRGYDDFAADELAPRLASAFGSSVAGADMSATSDEAWLRGRGTVNPAECPLTCGWDSRHVMASPKASLPKVRSLQTHEAAPLSAEQEKLHGEAERQLADLLARRPTVKPAGAEGRGLSHIPVTRPLNAGEMAVPRWELLCQELHRKLDMWVACKRAKDFASADIIKEELRGGGAQPDTWRPADNKAPKVPPMALLNAWVQQTASAEACLRCFEIYDPYIADNSHAIWCSTIWSKLSKCQYAGYAPNRGPVVYEMLMRRTVECAPLMDVRASATCMHGCAKCVVDWPEGPRLDKARAMLAVVKDRFVSLRLRDCTDQNMAMSVWALARISFEADDLFIMVAHAVIRQQVMVKPQALTQIAWAFAHSARHQEDVIGPMFAQLAQVMVCSIAEATPNQLSTTCWAFAKLSQRGPAADSLFLATAGVMTRTQVRGWPAQDMSQLVWSFATVGVRAERCFRIVAAETLRSLRSDDYRPFEWRSGDFRPQDLANLMWAFATAHIKDDELFSMCAQAAIRFGMDQFSTQGMSNMVWACATVGVRPDALFAAVAEAHVANSLSGCNTQDVANTAWAFAVLGVQAHALYMTIANAAMQIGMDDFKPRELAITVWSFAKYGTDETPHFFDMQRSDRAFNYPEEFDNLFAAAEEAALVSQLSDFNAQDLSNTAWGFTTAMRPATELFAAIAYKAVREHMVSHFSSQHLSNIAWAFAMACVRADDLFDAIKDVLLETDLSKFDTQSLASLSWSFAVADVYDPVLHPKLVNRIASYLRDEQSQTDNVMSQFHLWMLWMTTERKLPLPPLVCAPARRLAPTLLQTSRLQREIFAELGSLFSGFVEEFTEPTTGYVVDLALPSACVAIEVDGPKHYLSRGDGHYLPTGNTLLKRRLVKAAKWHLIVITWLEWSIAKGRLAHHSLLRMKLASVGLISPE